MAVDVSENPDVCVSATLAKHALMSFTLTKTLEHPADAYPQNRADQRSRSQSRAEAQHGAVTAMRATDSSLKRRRAEGESRASLLERKHRVPVLLV